MHVSHLKLISVPRVTTSHMVKVTCSPQCDCKWASTDCISHFSLPPSQGDSWQTCRGQETPVSPRQLQIPAGEGLSRMVHTWSNCFLRGEFTVRMKRDMRGMRTYLIEPCGGMESYFLPVIIRGSSNGPGDLSKRQYPATDLQIILFSTQWMPESTDHNEPLCTSMVTLSDNCHGH